MLTTWDFFAYAAPYVIFGFLSVGLIKTVIPAEAVVRHLGGRSHSAVLKASLLGIHFTSLFMWRDTCGNRSS
jgi:uncharacterized membrane protein YraQ (UPF0718 family)